MSSVDSFPATPVNWSTMSAQQRDVLRAVDTNKNGVVTRVELSQARQEAEKLRGRVQQATQAINAKIANTPRNSPGLKPLLAERDALFEQSITLSGFLTQINELERGSDVQYVDPALLPELQRTASLVARELELRLHAIEDAFTRGAARPVPRQTPPAGHARAAAALEPPKQVAPTIGAGTTPAPHGPRPPFEIERFAPF